MPIEALVWSLLMVLSPGLGPRLWPGLYPRFAWIPIGLPAWAPWIQSLGIPYLALILGSVSDRQVGLVGLGPEAWFSGGLACALGLAMAWIVARRSHRTPDPEVDADTVLREEARWGFYRGAAALWLPGPYAPAIGLGLAIVEMGVTYASIHGRQPPSTATWKDFLRALFSTILFVMTANLWLVAGTQLLLTALLKKQKANGSIEPPA